LADEQRLLSEMRLEDDQKVFVRIGRQHSQIASKQRRC
jgi:hypothetical protein